MKWPWRKRLPWPWSTRLWFEAYNLVHGEPPWPDPNERPIVFLRLERGGLYRVVVWPKAAEGFDVPQCGDRIACNRLADFVNIGIEVRLEQELANRKPSPSFTYIEEFQ